MKFEQILNIVLEEFDCEKGGSFDDGVKLIKIAEKIQRNLENDIKQDVSKRYCKFCTHRTTIDLKEGSPINYCPKNKMLVRNDTNGCDRMELGKHKIAYVFNVC